MVENYNAAECNCHWKYLTQMDKTTRWTWNKKNKNIFIIISYKKGFFLVFTSPVCQNRVIASNVWSVRETHDQYSNTRQIYYSPRYVYQEWILREICSVLLTMCEIIGGLINKIMPYHFVSTAPADGLTLCFDMETNVCWQPHTADDVLEGAALIKMFTFQIHLNLIVYVKKSMLIHVIARHWKAIA